MRTGLSLTSFFIGASAAAQVWCPDGATWHFGFAYGTVNGYYRYAYAGDTLLAGKAGKVIDRSQHYYTWTPGPVINHFNMPDVYTAMEDSVLYIWHSESGFFPPYWDTLAWFGAHPGDHWQVLQPEDFGCACDYAVIDTGHVDIAGMSLRYVRTTTDCGWAGPAEPTFIERIGSVHGTFFDECQTGEPDTTLRCYEDIDMSYVTGIASTCDQIVGVDEPVAPAPFALAHDASWEALELRFSSPTTSDLRLRLIDASGRTHEEVLIPRGSISHRISTTGLASGLRVAQVCDAGKGCWAVKWVKE